MNADGHGVTRCTGWSAGKLFPRFRHFHHPWRSLVALLWLVGLGACDMRPSAPETRASYFVKKFIVDPRNDSDLRAVTQVPANESPESLAGDLQTRAAVSYLRARHRLGAELGFHVAGTNRLANGNKVVNVVVSEGVATVGKDAVVRFQVELSNQNRHWLIVRLQSD